MDRLSDEQLMAAALAGERDALAALVERYQGPLTGYLDRLVGADWALAQDLVQETFLRLLRRPASEAGRPVRPWLYAVATNLARDHFKSASVQRRVRLESVDQEQLLDTAAGPEDRALALERGAEIVAALGGLSPEYRAALALRFYVGMSLQEIACALDVPIGTVKSRLSVGLRRLREALSVTAGQQVGGKVL